MINRGYRVIYRGSWRCNQKYFKLCGHFPESEVEEEPADGQTASQGGVGEAQPGRDVRLLLQDAGPEVLLRAGDDAHVGGELVQLVQLGPGLDTEGGVEVGGVGVVALHVAGHVAPRGDADGQV